MIRVVLASSRYFIGAAVLGTFLLAASLIIYGLVSAAKLIADAVWNEPFDAHGARQLAVEAIDLTDLFLLGTVLYLISVGLYQLFIDPTLPAPRWMEIRHIDDLKVRLTGVAVVLLAVTFVGDVAAWEEARDVLELGLGVAAVIFALGVFAHFSHRGPVAEHRPDGDDEGTDPTPRLAGERD